MKLYATNKLILFFVFISTASPSFSQSRKSIEHVFHQIENLSIDGDLIEWQDYLRPINSDSSWCYAIGMDRENLYVSMQIRNVKLQQEAMRSGVLLNINMEGKQRNGARLLFPAPDKESIREMLQEQTDPGADFREVLLAKTHGYLIEGFPTLVDGLLSLENTYGIHAAVSVDNDDWLCYEGVVPLRLLQRIKGQDKITVQLAINNRWMQLEKIRKQNPSSPWMGSSRYGHPQKTTKNPYTFPTEVWVTGKMPR